MPGSAQIKNPTPYERWSAESTLFGSGHTWTKTAVVNEVIDGRAIRCAQGQSHDGYWFNLEVATAAHEAEFWRRYWDWRKTAAGEHETFSVTAADPYKKCGTATTPPCGPDGDLDQAIRSLAKAIAGVGASTAKVEAAIVSVKQMLTSTADAARKMLG